MWIKQYQCAEMRSMLTKQLYFFPAICIQQADRNPHQSTDEEDLCKRAVKPWTDLERLHRLRNETVGVSVVLGTNIYNTCSHY